MLIGDYSTGGVKVAQVEIPFQNLQLDIEITTEGVQIPQIYVAASIKGSNMNNAVLFPKTLLSTLILGQSCDNGAVYFKKATFVEGSMTEAGRMIFNYNLAKENSLPIDGTNMLELEFTLPTGQVMQVYGFETTSIDNIATFINTLLVSDSGKVVNVENQDMMIFNPSEVENIVLHYNNGKQINYSSKQLEMLQAEINESVMVVDGAIVNGIDFKAYCNGLIALPMYPYTKAEIYGSTTLTFFRTDKVNSKKVSKAEMTIQSIQKAQHASVGALDKNVRNFKFGNALRGRR